jgi:hypothetical protein
MKNREKFAEQIIDIALKRCGIAVNLTSGNPCACAETNCFDCLFHGKDKACEVLLREWAEKEYEEQSVDWSKVAVDTPILVKSYEYKEWSHRYFAKYENGKVHTWGFGATSWSTETCATYTWEFAKLAEEVES